MRLWSLILVIFTLLCAPPASADVVTGRNGADTPFNTRQILRDYDRAVQQAVGLLFSISPDGAVTAAALDAHRQHQMSIQRARTLGKLLSFDLNGDLQISTEEVQALHITLSSNALADLVTQIALADGTGDGALSQAELMAFAGRSARDAGSVKLYGAELTEYDADGDGVVTVSDVQTILRAIRTEAEQPKPPATPERSFVTPQSKSQVSKPGESAAACRFATPARPSEAWIISTKGGAGLSTVTLGGDSVLTSVVQLNIPTGDGGLYLVLGGADHLIWQITGSVARVERVVLPETQAVVGVAEELITFESNPKCLPRAPLGTSIRNEATIRGHLSRVAGIGDIRNTGAFKMGVVDLTLGRETFDLRQPPLAGQPKYVDGQLHVPDEGGRTRAATPIEAAAFWQTRRLFREFRRGEMALDAAAVVTAPRIEARNYGIKPASAGLVQLLESGAVQPHPDRPAHNNDAFRIVAPVDALPVWPAPWQPITYFLAEGVPAPKVIPDRVNVFQLPEGTCLSGSQCPGK